MISQTLIASNFYSPKMTICEAVERGRPPPHLWGVSKASDMTEAPRRDLTFTDFLDDAWNVMRSRLPLDADLALLLAANDAAYDVLGRIMRAERRPGLDEATAMLLDLARMKVIGRIAMLDTWRRARLGKFVPFAPKSMFDQGYPPNIREAIPRRGEDSGYARAMRMKSEQLERGIASVDGIADKNR
jgi:hypothetical protein